MLGDPQALTLSGNAVNLPRVGMSLTESRYQGTIGASQLSLELSGSVTARKRARFVARLTQSVGLPDPLSPGGILLPSSATVTVTLDRPAGGIWPAVSSVDLAKALRSWLTDGVLLQLVNGER